MNRKEIEGIVDSLIRGYNGTGFSGVYRIREGYRREDERRMAVIIIRRMEGYLEGKNASERIYSLDGELREEILMHIERLKIIESRDGHEEG